MAEKSIPWWRKALNFALDGIRSGFGLFPRHGKPELAPEPGFSANSKEIHAPEPALEEESELTEIFPKVEVATAPPAQYEEAIEAKASSAADAAPASTGDLGPAAPSEPDPIAPNEPEMEAETKAEYDPEETATSIDAVTEQAEGSGFMAEPEVELATRPVSEPGAAPEAVVEATAESQPEPMDASKAEASLDAVPLRPEAAEAVVEAAPVTTTVLGPEVAPVFVTAPASVIESEQAAETKPEDEAPIDAAVEMPEVAEVIAEGVADPAIVPVPEPEPTIIAVSEPVAEAEPEPEAAFETEAPVCAEGELSGAAELLANSQPEPSAPAIPEAEIAAVPKPEPAIQQGAVTEIVEERVQPAEPEAAPKEDSEPAIVAASEPETVPESVVEPAPASIDAAQPAAVKPEPTPAPDAAPTLVLTTPPAADERAAAKLAARQKKLDENAEQSPFSVIVGQVYDGPLDLLLDLIRKQDIDIYDIPIATITAQFLSYVNQLKASDVDVAGEFIYIASLLIHIKSKMLLPRSAAGPEEAAEDPRRELVERLLEHERFKNAAQMLQQKQMLEAASWTNPGAQEFKDDEGAEPEIAADTVDLVRIFRDILERARKRPVLDVSEDSVTVGQMVQFLARRLTMEDKPVALRRLLSHTRSERALIAMFLALLELVRLQAVLLRQDRAFSEIFIKKHTGFEAVMNEGLANTRDDWR